MESIDIVRKQVAESERVKAELSKNEEVIAAIAKAADVCTEAYRRGNKTMFAGNGGSAADAQHLVGEFVSKFYFDRPGIPSIALTTDTSVITAIGNDYGYDKIFTRQLQAQGVAGNSKNIVDALPICKEKGITTIALTGMKSCKMDDFDIVIKVPSAETPRIQECQTLIGHIICCIVEENIFGEEYNK